jgi:archaellum component FlaG (FlaF/FlaG flagellin family)
MADGGASELIMLISGLMVAGIVTTLLIASWGGLANSVDTVQNQAEANSKTNAALASDPMQVSWDQPSCNLSLHIQNTGALELLDSEIGIIANGTASTVNQTRLLGNSSTWTSGEVLELQVCPSGVTMSAGQEIIVTVVVRSEHYQGISGRYSFSEVVRLV